jgi:hypothetical protein
MSARSSGGIGFTGLLVIAFIVLKLTHFIAWSWLWVLSPIWISAGLVIAFLGVLVIVAIVSRNRRIAREGSKLMRQ